MKVFKLTVIALLLIGINQTVEAQNNETRRVKQTKLAPVTKTVEESKEVSIETVNSEVKQIAVDKVAELKAERKLASVSDKLKIDKTINELENKLISKGNSVQIPASLKALNATLDKNRAEVVMAKSKLEIAKNTLKEQQLANKLSETELLNKQNKIASVEEKVKALEASIAKGEQLLNSKL
ncbi:hypothetical protein [Aurantibacter sp.]|uniref:hypothetical protein n=1 Tax=Aurantibacter sp. TaxID=2807103 RepID=UPI0035C7A73F